MKFIINTSNSHWNFANAIDIWLIHISWKCGLMKSKQFVQYFYYFFPLVNLANSYFYSRLFIHCAHLAPRFTLHSPIWIVRAENKHWHQMQNSIFHNSAKMFRLYLYNLFVCQTKSNRMQMVVNLLRQKLYLYWQISQMFMSVLPSKSWVLCF